MHYHKTFSRKALKCLELPKVPKKPDTPDTFARRNNLKPKIVIVRQADPDYRPFLR